MVSGTTMAILAAATFVGGFYVASSQSGKKMCSADYATRLAGFQTGCAAGTPPSAFDLMKYYIGL